jgi:hypothetical protein
MTPEQRLERLERENRWMRRIGAVGPLLSSTFSSPVTAGAALPLYLSVAAFSRR